MRVWLSTVITVTLFVPCMSTAVVAAEPAAGEWPVLRRFDGDRLLRVALPMGGIGCGSVSLSGRGDLVDWEIMNRANKTLSESDRKADSRTFFAIRVKGSGHESVTMLAGPIHPTELYADEGNSVPQAGLPRFRKASFEGAFPFGTVRLSDRDLPVKVTIKGFSPFVPGDSAASSLPVAALEYEVENLSGDSLEVSVAAFVRNIVGNDGRMKGVTKRGLTHTGGEKGNRTEFRSSGDIRGITCLSDGVPPDSPAYGTFSLVTSDADASVSFRERCVGNAWRRTILEFWDDLSDDGSLKEPPSSSKSTPHGGLCLKRNVPAGEKVPFRFAFTWNFPNRPAWADEKTIVGNWYSGNYTDSWDAALKIVPRLGALRERSLAFTRKIVSLDAPAVLKEAALSSLSVLKSQTVFRLPSGHLMGWEGVFNHEGSCYGSCTHVWNYENAVACLFPDLARTMRDVEFNYASDSETGAMDFRTKLPLGSARTGATAADGQMGTIMKAYRDWKISRDDAFLRTFWPKVRKALEFAWRKGGWDPEKSGLMDGKQHNTMDVDYYGPNPQMGFWYLGALRAAEEMATAAGDVDFAAVCRRVFEKGSARIDAELFNGDYYEQKIPEGMEDAPYQLGKCCLVDQLVGQQMAHLWGLGDLAERKNLKKTCESIMKWNFKKDFTRHFNNMRVYCAGEESGTLMGSWPRGRLEVPFPYFAEVMTGFEYVAAAEMIFQGMDDAALDVVGAVRDRHDGLRRNPFSEAECGHNYARSMASWNCLLAWVMMHGGDRADLIWNSGTPRRQPVLQLRLRRSDTESDANWESTRKIITENPGCCDEVWFSTGTGIPSTELHADRAARMARAADDMRAAGIVPSLQFQATIGHGDTHSQEDYVSAKIWTGWTGSTGVEAKTCSCPRHPEFLAYVRTVARLYAAFRPAAVWIDDDLRLLNHRPATDGSRPGCWCARCVADFGAETGTAWTRAGLDAAMKDDPALAERWTGFSVGSLTAVARAIAEEFRKASPGTMLALQHGMVDTGTIVRILDELHAVGGRSVGFRPGAGSYYDIDPNSQIWKSLRSARFRKTIGDPDRISPWTAEIECWPRVYGSRSAQSVLTESFCALMYGMDAVSLFVFQTGNETAELYSREMLRPLADGAPVLRGYASENEGTVAAGFSGGYGTAELQKFAATAIPVLFGPGREYGTLSAEDMKLDRCTMTSRTVQAARDSLDARAGGTAAVVCSPFVGLMLPRVSGKDGSLRTVALLNLRIDSQGPVELRLKGVPQGVSGAVWRELRRPPVPVRLRRDGGRVHAVIPGIAAWNAGYLSFAAPL